MFLRGMPWAHNAFKIRSSIFLFVVVVVFLFFFIVVANGNEIKTCPPLEGIFLCSIVLIVFNNLLRFHQGGREEQAFLLVWRHIRMGQGFFQTTDHFVYMF